MESKTNSLVRIGAYLYPEEKKALEEKLRLVEKKLHLKISTSSWMRQQILKFLDTPIDQFGSE